MEMTNVENDCQEMVYHLYKHTFAEAKKNGVVDVSQVYKSVCDLTGHTEMEVEQILKKFDNILNQSNSGDNKVLDTDKYDPQLIYNLIYNYVVIHNSLPTVRNILKELKELSAFDGDKLALLKVAHSLGFRVHNSNILLELQRARLKRIEFIRKLQSARTKGKNIVYLMSNYSQYVDRVKNNSKALIPSDVVFAHAAGEKGFYNTFYLGQKHKEATDLYKSWIYNMLIPNLPLNAVLVCHKDIADFFNGLAPSNNAIKSSLMTWLNDRGISVNEDMLKPELYELANKHKKFLFYTELGIEILSTPPHHPQLDPAHVLWKRIETALVDILGSNKFCNVNHQAKINYIFDFIKKHVNEIDKDKWNETIVAAKRQEGVVLEVEALLDQCLEKKLYPVSIKDEDCDVF